MTEIITHRFTTDDPRLGRHVRHDPRSRAYAVAPAADVTKLKSVRHVRHIPVLDQGQIGSCTGNAAVGCLGTGPFYTGKARRLLHGMPARLVEQYAVGIYAAATIIDPYEGTYPPTDTGSDGLSVAQALRGSDMISGYRHAFSLEAALTALAAQPIITGVSWHNGMDSPGQRGQIKPTGAVRGGHEFVLDELDVPNRRVWLTNSWSKSWGKQGRAWLSWDSFGALLADSGDVTVFNLPTTAKEA